MPKNRKDDSDSSSASESDSGPDDRDEPPPKKSKSGGSGAKAKKNDIGETYFDLEGYKRVTVRDFKGKVYVDIREFYEKDGKVLPGKKGISLSASAWNKLKSLTDDVDETLKELR